MDWLERTPPGVKVVGLLASMLLTMFAARLSGPYQDIGVGLGVLLALLTIIGFGLHFFKEKRGGSSVSPADLVALGLVGSTSFLLLIVGGIVWAQFYTPPPPPPPALAPQPVTVVVPSPADKAKIAELEAKLDQRERRKAIRVGLSQFLTEGMALLQENADETKPAPLEKSTKWLERLEAFLREQMDDSYIARVNDGSDMPLQTTSLQDQSHIKLQGGLRIRLYNLKQFLKELGD